MSDRPPPTDPTAAPADPTGAFDDVTRRGFLRATALAAATAAAHGAFLGGPGRSRAAAPAAARATPDGVTWDKAPCRFCGTGCHVQVGVREGRVVAIRGDERADVNKGLLCVKGYHVGLALYGQDRLTRPLLRRDGALVPISWTEAVDVIARRVLDDPAAFAFYGSGQWTIPEGYAAQKLMKAGLSNNHIDPNARLCMASAVTGFLAVYGVDEPAGCYDDLDVCDVLIMWGNNPAEMHPILFSRVVDRRARGEQIELIDIGTRRTRTTDHCQRYLEFTPHSDLAIANGVMHLLLERGTYDRDFVERHVNFRADSDPPALTGEAIDFDAFRGALAKYTPAYVEAISGVPRAEIEHLADLFGDPKLRITSLWCMGMNQHTRGTAINSLVHGLHLLSGHFGRPGDAPTSLTGQPSACGTVREVGTLSHALPGGLVVTNEANRETAEELWNLPPGRINPTPGLHTVEMFRDFCTPTRDGAKLKTMWVQVTNPGQSMPNLNALFRKKAEAGLEDKFLIVSEVYPTETTRLADLVLPSAMWVEKNGIYGNSERRTQQWFKMVEPPGEARDDCWQTIAVAHRLLELGHEGMKDKDGRFLFDIRDAAGEPVPVWRWERYYDVNVDEQLFEQYRPFTRFKHKDLAPYPEYVKARGLRWPVVEERDGVWRETRWRFSEHDDRYVKAGAGQQFYHSVTGDDRALVWFRPYEPPPEVPDEDYPYWLCTGRVLEHWHTGTMTMRVAALRNAMPGAYVELHPEDARELGVGNGDRVLLETRRGKLELRAWLNGRGLPARKNVFVPFFDETRLVNLLTLEDYDPFSRQPDYKKCAVRLTRVGA